MKYFTNIDDIEIQGKSAVTLGKFEGIHRGHQELITKIIKKKNEGFNAVVFTFEKPVGAFLRGTEYKVLLTKEERRERFKALNPDYIVECPMNESIFHMEAESFIEDILVKRLNIKYIAVGTDFRFGYKAKGDYKLLKEFAQKYDYEVEVVEKVLYSGEEISSTRIRKCIEDGDIDSANKMLGFNYPITEQVIHGRKLGRELGMPTANVLPPKEKLLPPFGVYVSAVEIEGKRYGGITNIGFKPTVTEDRVCLSETFIFDYSGDLYGKRLSFELLIHERPEQKFSSIDELKMKMHKDILFGRKYIVDNLI